jgi:hypothetical protein
MRLSKSIDDNRDVHATLISIDVGSSNRKSEGGADIEHGDFFEECILANVLWTQRTGVPADPSPRAPPHTLLSVKQLFK